jgi:Zn-dependent protease
VFLAEPAPTQFDLRFRLFGVRVRVSPWFWVMGAALGWGGGPGNNPLFLPGLAVWIGAVFVSILIHELGHVFMGRAFGSDGHIVLYHFGGLAIGSNALGDGRKRALVSFAGPLAQFILLGITLAVVWGVMIPPAHRPHLAWNSEVIWDFFDALRAAPYHPLVKRFVLAMILINLFWPILNLLPIWPLDGGMISREVCTGLSRENGLRISLGISLVVAALLAINSLVAMKREEPLIPVIGWLFAGGIFMAVMFGLFAFQSLQMLQAAEAERRWHDDHWQE